MIILSKYTSTNLYSDKGGLVTVIRVHYHLMVGPCQVEGAIDGSGAQGIQAILYPWKSVSVLQGHQTGKSALPRLSETSRGAVYGQPDGFGIPSWNPMDLCFSPPHILVALTENGTISIQ